MQLSRDENGDVLERHDAALNLNSTKTGDS